MAVVVIAMLVLVSNGTIEEQTGRNFFALFAIFFGIGFVRDAFRGEGGPQGIRSVTIKFTALAFTLGLIVGGVDRELAAAHHERRCCGGCCSR